MLAAALALLLMGCQPAPVARPQASRPPAQAAPNARSTRVRLTPAPATPTLAPAPKATPTPSPLAPTLTPAAYLAPTPSQPDSPSLLRAWLRQLKTAPVATPAAPSPILRRGQRIDAIGPVPLPTVAPLEPGDGLPPVRLQIPALSLDTPVQRMGWRVVDGVRQWDVVDHAAGHHFDSANAGERGNVVISGHNNIAGAVFAPVCVIGQPGVDLGLGDAVILTDAAGREFTYRIDGWRRLPERNASLSQRQENADYLQPTAYARLTLITCWPPWSNTHRVVITAALTAKPAPLLHR